MVAKKRVALDASKAGYSLGIVFAAYHLVWVLLLAATGGSFYGMISQFHFVQPTQALPVDWLTAVLGVIGAFVTGYVTGWFFAWVWNRL